MAALTKARMFCEFKHLLSVLKVYLKDDSFSPKCKDDVEISISNTTISVEIHNTKATYTIQGLHMMPDTCRGLTYHPATRELQFNVQVKPVAGDTLNNFPNTKRKKFQDLLVEYIQTNQDKCYCRACGQKLLANEMKFRNVYPLPSDDWSNFTDIWFCHQHGDQSEADSPGSVSMLPRSHDCHVGDLYFLVDSGHVTRGGVREQCDVICCSRCQNIIGDVSVVPNQNGMVSKNARTVYKLYETAVVFQEFKEDQMLSTEIQNSSSEGSFAQYMYEKSHLYTSFKFLISAKSKGRVIHLLVWLLDMDIQLFQGDLKQGDSGTVKPRQCIKLLFQAYGLGENGKWKNDALYIQWKKDNSVQQLMLPYTLLLDLVSILVNNSKTVPDSVRLCDGLLEEVDVAEKKMKNAKMCDVVSFQ